MSAPVTLVVSIDTEEDNWAPTRSGITVSNVRALQRLHRVFEGLGVRATYFVNYQVASDPTGREIVRELHASGRAEIGSHLHPWNTPPLDEPLTAAGTMTCNLPGPLQRAKVERLTDTLADTIGRQPMAFRAGRWALAPETVGVLIDAGYRVDSSVTPYTSWADSGGVNHVGAPLHPYRLGHQRDVRVPSPGGPLWELPVTWGYSRRPFGPWGAVHRGLDRQPWRWLRFAGITARTGLLRKIALSPELYSVDDMVLLSRHVIDQGVPLLHLFWHSPSLCPGLTPFVVTRADVERLYARVDAYLDRLAAFADVRCATVSEVVDGRGEVDELAGRWRSSTSVHAVATPLSLASRGERQAGAPAGDGKRLVVLSYHFPSDGAVGGLRWAALGKYLGRLGWQTWIVTAAPPSVRHATANVSVVSRARRRTLGEVYRSIRIAMARRHQSAAATTLQPERWSWSRRLRFECAMLLAHPDQARGWILGAAARARRLIEEVRPDVVVSTGPPHSAHVAAWLATRGTECRWVVDLRDPWAAPLSAPWRRLRQHQSYVGRGLTVSLEALALNGCDGVFCNTQHFAVALRDRYPRVRVQWVPNAVDHELLPAVQRGPAPALEIIHAGTIYGSRDLTPLLRGLRMFLERHPDVQPGGCTLRVVGHIDSPFDERLRAEIGRLDLAPYVEITGVTSRERALHLLARSQLAVVLAQDQAYQVPTKLYEAVALGLSALVIAEPRSAAWLEAGRIGATAVEAGDVEGIARLLASLWHGETRPPSGSGPVRYEDLAPVVDSLLSSKVVRTGQHLWRSVSELVRGHLGGAGSRPRHDDSMA